MAMQEQRIVELRSEIKSWEREHCRTHGQKPTRKDIAADCDIGGFNGATRPHVNASNTSIAAKYKEYENLRAILTGKSPPHASRKRKCEDHLLNTPSKRSEKTFTTPNKELHQVRMGEYVVENTPQRSRPLMLGPTPQKNGIFVGIFDAISVQTPSHRRSALVDVDDNSLQTPSKVASTPGSVHSKLTKTPMSEGKRFFLDQYITPRKHNPDDKTPSSIAKKYLTPAFFKQYTEAPRDTSAGETSEPKREPWRRPKFLRTLSSMIEDFKRENGEREEDEAFDEELEVLREIEREESLENAHSGSKTQSGTVQVLQSLPIDQDGFVTSDIEELKALPQAGAEEAEEKQPNKTRKKKGQKRQTRRVISGSLFPFHIDDRTNIRKSVRPTRTRIRKPTEDIFENLDGGTASETNGGLQPCVESGIKSDENVATVEPKPKQAVVDGDAKEKSKTAGRRKTQDHANYRRLKIKNKKSNGKGGAFARRR
jgi:hypothetical protein